MFDELINKQQRTTKEKAKTDWLAQIFILRLQFTLCESWLKLIVYLDACNYFMKYECFKRFF